MSQSLDNFEDRVNLEGNLLKNLDPFFSSHKKQIPVMSQLEKAPVKYNQSNHVMQDVQKVPHETVAHS